eukprot:g5170.t1
MPSRCRMFQLDLEASDAEAIGRVLSDFRPNVILHFAAMASLGACEKDPAAARRVNASPAFLAAVRAHCPACHVVLASTDQVFDGTGPLPYDPTAAQPQPVNAYGASKAAMEEALQAGWPGCGARTIVRLSNVVGPAAPFAPGTGKFLQWLERELADDDDGGGGDGSSPGTPRQLTLFEDELRCYVFVKDVAELFLGVARGDHEDHHGKEGPEGEKHAKTAAKVIHCGGPDSLSRVDVGKLVLVCRSHRGGGSACSGGNAGG